MDGRIPGEQRVDEPADRHVDLERAPSLGQVVAAVELEQLHRRLGEAFASAWAVPCPRSRR